MTSPQADDHLAEKRTEPPLAGDESATLSGFLDYQRQTLLLKCTGLVPAQLVSRPVPPSGLSLLGLLRHLTEVEFWWLHVCFAGGPDEEIYGPDDADFAVTEADEQSVADAVDRYTAMIEGSRRIAAGADPAARSVRASERTGEHFSLRWILTHLIEEYARHNGHADLVREAIDGSVGE